MLYMYEPSRTPSKSTSALSALIHFFGVEIRIRIRYLDPSYRVAIRMTLLHSLDRLYIAWLFHRHLQAAKAASAKAALRSLACLW